MSNHYYYKNGASNIYLQQEVVLHQKEAKELKKISLYLGFGLCLKDYKHEGEMKGFDKSSFDQMRTIQKAMKAYEEGGNNYYWLFYETDIYVFKQTGHLRLDEDYCNRIKVDNIDISKPMEDQDVKWFECELVAKLNKCDVVPSFCAVGSWQKYNRKTIIEFDSNDFGQDFLDALMSAKKLGEKPQTIEEQIKYLNPLYTETFCFLCLYESGHNPSYKGGNVSTYDFVCEGVEIEGKRFKYISIKRDNVSDIEDKGEIVVLNRNGINLYLFSKLDATKQERIKKWISANTIDKKPFA